MNLTRTVLFRAFRNIYRYQCSTSRNLPYVKVLCSEDDDNIKLTFKYLNSRNLVIRTLKEDNVQNVLSRIKLMVGLQLKKEEIRQVFINKQSNTATIAQKESIEDLDVCFFPHDNFVYEKASNMEAWIQASQLKIGDILYDIKYNLPSVISLTLPEYILSGCSLRPHLRLECAVLEDCRFKWYRSQSRDKIMQLPNVQNPDNVLIEEDKCWVKVYEGFIYTTCAEDVGCLLKVDCIPRRGDYEGNVYSVESISPVEAIPDKLPFEERQKHTKSITDNDSFRCVSYNTLANSYVEKKKFPYCSEKARNYYYRKQLLFREIIGYNSDILCMQEVEERVFEADFTPILKEVGLDGVYKKKGGRRYEGLATFYRSDKFRLLKNYGVLLKNIIHEDVYKDLRTKIGGSNKDVGLLLKQDSACQVLLLQNIKQPDNKIVVANTHLYSNKDTPEVRFMQAAVCTNYIEHVIKTEELDSAGVLFCGDFNSLPSSDTYQFMISGKCCPAWNNSASSDVETELLHNLDFDSACGTPDYTNYTEEFSGCLDYIFYNKKHLQVTEIVPMPKHEDVIANVGLPNEYFPSDHIALVCTFKWNNS